MARRFSDYFLEDADPQNVVNYIRRMKQDIEQQGLSFVDINLFDILPDVITNIITLNSTGDVVGPASATGGHISIFDDATGKLIADGGKTIADVIAYSGDVLYFDNSASPLDGKNLVRVLTQDPITLDTTLSGSGWFTIGEFTSSPIGSASIPVGAWMFTFWISASATFTPSSVKVLIYRRNTGGLLQQITAWEFQSNAPMLTTTPQEMTASLIFDTPYPYSAQTMSEEDSILVLIEVQKIGGSDVDVSINLNDQDYPAYIRTPYFPIDFSAFGNMSKAVYDTNNRETDVFHEIARADVMARQRNWFLS